jgi:hypothetical protein
MAYMMAAVYKYPYEAPLPFFRPMTLIKFDGHLVIGLACPTQH